MNSSRPLPASIFLGLLLAASVASADPLESGFLTPPNSAKPQTWWHWMNGNITKAGITADLEAMKQIGLGGATIVVVDCEIPRGPVDFMSAEWREDFKFAVQEANRLGLELCVENCAGWSSSGGPWNTVTNAMMRVTTSEVRVTGPTNFSATLSQPPTTLGFYRDIAVLAFPAPAEEDVRMKDFSPNASTSSSEQPGNQLTDGDSKTFIRLPLPKRGKPQFAQLEFSKSFPTRTVKIVGAPGMPESSGELQVSDDGKTFRTLKSFAFGRRGLLVRTLVLGAQPVSAKFWRVSFTNVTARALATATNIPLAEIELAPRLTIENIDAKAGFNGNEVVSTREADTAADGTVQRGEVVELTSKMTADGKLNWRVPAGEWIIQRFGFTPTGVNNHPATKEGTGLECDKFSKTALDAHWDGFMKVILEDIGPLGIKTLNTSLIDSYEVGGQNWNAEFRKEFQQRRGYDPLKYLPTFTGRVVDNPMISERFLWDVRRTIADLIAENYFGHFAELCKQHGLLNAVEPYTGPFESMQSGAPADVVMGEFWSGSSGHASVKLAASIAHIYGKSIVAAESFTAAPDAGRWLNDPYSLKTLGDLMYCQGLNRYVFHRYAMQPWTNTFPGMTMGQWGFHFERTSTWWNQGKPWIDYISHCEFLLQQGRAVADAAYFTGESAPSEMRVGNPALPAGYDYDAINADVLLHGATVKAGRITLKSGANYAALILPPNDSDLTPQLLECIAKLVRAGATVVGPRPQHSPSLTDFPKCDAQVKKLADTLWGKCDGSSVQENFVGKGRIVWGKSLAEVFAAQKLNPDFECAGVEKKSRLAFVHRVAGEADIYFVSNQRRQFDSADCTFRISGKLPELWHPDTGVMEPAPVWHEQDGRTTVRLNFQPAESVFVIFRRAATGADHVTAASGSVNVNTAQQPKLEIHHAVYTATDGAGQIDVTARLSELVRAGEEVITANNDMMGRDPTPNHEKELRVDYSLDGQRSQVSVKENETLALLPTGNLGEPPQWETSVASDGSPTVKTWSQGRVELHTASGKVLHAAAENLPAPQEVSGEWTLNFPPNWGAPPMVALDKLISWTDHTNAGVRYFSGTASYEKEIEIPTDRFATRRELWLDLGAVKNFAEVSLNGNDLEVLWKPPFRVNITAAAKPGVNKLVVKVTNLWPNRLIGDEQLPADVEWNGKQLAEWPQWFLDGKPSPTGRLTFTTWHHWTKTSPLLESGLLGPVTLRSAEIIPAQ
jgi:hypothetical protein